MDIVWYGTSNFSGIQVLVIVMLCRIMYMYMEQTWKESPMFSCHCLLKPQRENMEKAQITKFDMTTMAGCQNRKCNQQLSNSTNDTMSDFGDTCY